MAEAELKISSTSVERTTLAVDKLVESLVKLGQGAENTETQNEKLSNSQKQRATALKNANIASEKAIALLNLEQKGLDKTSQEYAELKAAILAKEVATKKGIDTSSKEFKALKNNITAKEKATAETKRLALAQKRLTQDTKGSNTGINNFANSLDKATAQVQLIDGPLGGIASRMSAFSRILKGGNLALAGLGLGLALVSKQLWDGVNVADKAEVAMAGISAQLLATNNASGQTAESLDHLSRSLAFATLDNTQGVRNLVGIMNGFKKVSGDAFTRAIELSQDLGLAMRQSPETAARTLGKVLENPIKNYKQLKRSGLEFSRVEKENLKLAQQRGDLYASQDIILKKLEGTFRGVAAAQADTLSGDRDTLGQNWEELWEFLGQKMIPVFREVTQAANSAVVVARELLETDIETRFREWSVSSKYFNDSTEDLESNLAGMKVELSNLTAEMDTSEGSFSKMAKSVAEQFALGKVWKEGEENNTEVLKLQIKAIEDLVKARKDGLEGRDTSGVSEEARKALEDNERLLSQQKRLTKVFLETGSTRSKAYRDVKAEIDAEKVALKTNLSLKNEEFSQLKNTNIAISDLTESRVRANTVLQKTKALESQQRGLEKEIALRKLAKDGIAQNSDAYFKAASAIDARNATVQAGFEIGSKEHLLIKKQTDALAELQIEAQKAKDFSASGLTLSDAGRVLVSGSEEALKYADTKLRGKLLQLMIDGEIDKGTYEQRIDEIAEIAQERLKTKLIPLGFTADEEGKELLLGSVEAVINEKNLLMSELDEAYREGEITNYSLYRERKAAIAREFSEKENAAIIAAHRATTEHLQAMRIKDAANSAAQGLKNLAMVAGNNKKLAKMAKLSSMFSASVSLVDGLAEANKLPWPANLGAYASALVQGTQLVSMASNLNEPSFAFGGVDIKGAGTARSDSIKANIANGESVITATATNRHKDTLRRMNSGLPLKGNSGGSNITTSINIQGDASEQTVGLIEEKLRDFEDRVQQIADGAALNTIQDQQTVGGLFNEF